MCVDRLTLHQFSHLQQVDTAMAAFALTCAGALACLILRAWTVEGASIVASRRLHRALLDRVLHAPMGEWAPRLGVCVSCSIVGLARADG